MELTYEKNGDYLIPNLIPDSEPEETADQVRSDAQEIPDGTTEGIYSGC